MSGRHGDWPLYPPDRDHRGSEDWWLYEQVSAPLEYGRCECEAECECDDDER